MIRQIARQFASRHVAECELMLEGMAVLIPMEDEPVHTSSHPYCSDLSCPCQGERAWQALQAVPSYIERIARGEEPNI